MKRTLIVNSHLTAFKVKKKEPSSILLKHILDFTKEQDTLVLNFGPIFEDEQTKIISNIFILEYNSIYFFEDIQLLFSICQQLIEWLHHNTKKKRVAILCLHKLENLLLILSIYYTSLLKFDSCVHAFQFIWKEHFQNELTTYLSQHIKSFYRYLKFSDFLLGRCMLPSSWNQSLLLDTQYSVGKVLLYIKDEKKDIGKEFLVSLQQHGNILAQKIVKLEQNSKNAIEIDFNSIQIIGDFSIQLAFIQQGQLVLLCSATYNTIFLQCNIMEWSLEQLDTLYSFISKISVELTSIVSSNSNSKYTSSLFLIASQFDYCKKQEYSNLSFPSHFFTRKIQKLIIAQDVTSQPLEDEVYQQDTNSGLIAPYNSSLPCTPQHQIKSGNFGPKDSPTEICDEHSQQLPLKKVEPEESNIPVPPILLLPLNNTKPISTPTQVPQLNYIPLPPPISTSNGSIPLPPPIFPSTSIPPPPPVIGNLPPVPQQFGIQSKQLRNSIDIHIPHGTPLKVLHWNHIPAPTVQSESIWNSFNYTPSKSLDISLLENLFRKNAQSTNEKSSLENLSKPFSSLCVQSPVKRAFQDKTKPTTISILDPKRSRNIEIVLNNLKAINVVEIIDHLEFNLLEKSKFEFLLSNCIATDSQERESLLVYSSGNLAKADAFVLELSQIVNVKEKLMAIINLYDLEHNTKLLIVNVRKKLESLEQLKLSKCFQKILEVLLIIGNIMNRNGRKSVAKAFKFDILTKLQDIKSNNKSITLMDYLIHTLKRLEQEKKANFTTSIFEEQNTIKEASQISKQIITQSYKDFQQYMSVLKQIQLVMQAHQTNFSQIFIERFNREYTKMEELKMEVEFIKNKYEIMFTEVLQYYGQNATEYNDADELFFQQIVSFLQSFKEALDRDTLKAHSNNSIKVI